MRKVLKEGKFIRFIKDGCWEYIERHNCSGIVVIVPVTNEGELIFIEQYRPPVKSKVIEFPAGLAGDLDLHKKESLEEAARRELLEETGYAAKRIKKMYSGPVSCGCSADIVTIVKAEGLTKVGKGGGVEEENIKIHPTAIVKCDQWLKKKERQGYLIEPKIYTGLYFLKQYNKFS